MFADWLLPLALAAGAPATGTATLALTDVDPAPGDATETLGIDRDRHERMTVPVTIGGEGPFRFMIDTGSQSTVVTQRVTERLDLPSGGRAIVVGMASSEWADLVELDDMRVGTRVFDGLTAPVLDAHNVGADGIVGLDSLQGLRVLIDFKEGEMQVADADTSPSLRGYEIVVKARGKLGQLIITNAVIDGVRAAVIIDTGAQGSMGNLALRRKIRARQSYEVTSTDVHGMQIAGNLTVAKSVKIQDLDLSNIPITYADAPAFAALGLADRPALTLGMDHLRLFDRVAIDFDKRRILFDLPNGKLRQGTAQFPGDASRL